MELFEDIHSGCEADTYQPLLAYLRAKKTGQITPPYIPQYTLMSVEKLCQLAFLWHDAGFVTEAGQLAHWLLPLEKFTPLWCPEKEYNEKRAIASFSQLSKIEPIPGNPPDFDLTLFETAAFTLSGNGTSLGMIRAGDVEIRAMGPQAASLKFGIKGKGLNGWTRSAALPEVWLEAKPKCKGAEFTLDLRFVGLKPEAPLSFAFYVKAPSCQIGSEILKPKSLRRFNGETNRVIFQKVKIESSLIHKVQVIPLAGEGCFWDTDFLVSFEIHPFESQVRFSL